ncbi:MAG: hypothetical protein RLZZ175_3164 [Bacteroidota bacterium]|jgi:uncharacterized protein (TIGR02145 family)
MKKQLLTLSTLFITYFASAQVGVGTTSPSEALDVETSDATKTAIDINNTSTGDPKINFQLNGTTNFSIGIDNSDSDKLKIGTSALETNTRVTIDNTGNVGVGTSSPISGLDIQTSMGLKVTTITAATTLNNTHNVVLCNTGPYTVTLPAAASNTGRTYYIKNIDTDGDDITIDGNGSETIDGSATYVLDTYLRNVKLISNGTSWFVISDGNNGAITALTCGSATNNGTLTENAAASGASSDVPYTGGNGGTHSGQTVTSTGVTGLTATLSAGSLASGSGSLTYNITGTPASSGTATFALSIGGQTCSLTRTVDAAAPTCPIVTTIVDVTNPYTGKTWMDRNLGATRAATSSTDADAYGDLYQWGRAGDGHQCRNSSTTSTLSTTDTPGNSLFITNITSPSDWRSTQNDNLWQGVNGTNNPCPTGYRLPTETELNNERLSWVQAPISSTNTSTGAFASSLKLPVAGIRFYSDGSVINVATFGNYWSSNVSSTKARNLSFGSSVAVMRSDPRADGRSVRCIKN